MNLKTILSLTTLSAATAACAVTTDNTLCRIEVNSSEKQTIIAVPLVEVATGAEIPVTDIVLTTNLTDGDTILHKNGESWDAWVVDNGAWKPLVITEGMSTKWTKGAADVTLTCGDAIWVNRQSTSDPFYVYGQVPAKTTKPTIPASGVMKLMGNTQLNEAAVSEIISGSPKAGDRVIWANSANKMRRTELEYNMEDGWGMWVSSTNKVGVHTVVTTKFVTTDIPTVPAGQGFWYLAK